MEIKKKVVCFDFETNGLSPYENQPIELAAKSIELDGTSRELNLLIKCNKKLPDLIVKLTGITDDMLSSSGIEYEDAMQQLCNFMELNKEKPNEDIFLVGHNFLKFDIPFLKQYTDIRDIKLNKYTQRWDTAGHYKAKALGLHINDYKNIPDYHYAALTTRAAGLKFNLAVCCIDAGIELNDAHRAIGDTRATLELFKKQLDSFKMSRSWT